MLYVNKLRFDLKVSGLIGEMEAKIFIPSDSFLPILSKVCRTMGCPDPSGLSRFVNKLSITSLVRR
ncbi:hypothetical protein D9M68_506420 [compost metagenome]